MSCSHYFKIWTASSKVRNRYEAQTERPTFKRQNSKNNKAVNKEQDENLSVKEIDSEKITSPAIEKIHELICDLQNSLKSDNQNGRLLPIPAR
ncbi:hypothetical protein TNIN_285281 [Trichonephila inaurata madagascariensis]|uniref:Uncharacterized protein n=1 Tax=Trichonephila inaurata madagascariensis TaxID=2747483 RepID=A0A8X6X0F3_9ARAC|nr:hypothetical protein TNIN_285281 [Trichonephila inaurata madagascariensis]